MKLEALFICCLSLITKRGVSMTPKTLKTVLPIFKPKKENLAISPSKGLFKLPTIFL